MSQVFVLDANKQGKAAVYRRYPLTIILASAVEQPTLHPLRIKVDPGSHTTGIALVNEHTGEVVWAAELTHRGEQIKRDLDKRRAVRKSRRRRKTRYRKPRFANRRKRTGTLPPPSLESRVSNVLTWVRRLMRLCPIIAISQELARFDTQALEHPDIEGVDYQHGQLSGYEVREYVLLKWNHQCAYCDARDVPLELDHVQPRSKHGTDRVSNLTLACLSCNQRKGNRDVREFLHDDTARLARMLAHMKAPLRDAAAVNATRWALNARLKLLGAPVECGSGGLTRSNRVLRGLDKAHWLDAANVGRSTPASLIIKDIVPFHITATGHGSRQMCRMDKYGFPRTGPKQHKRVQGFQTGALARAVVTSGTKQGTYLGKVAARTRGCFNITTAQGMVTDIHHRYCTLIAQADGYTYQQRKEAALPPTA